MADVSRSDEPKKPVVLITGAAGGIGAATARHFHAIGYKIVLADTRLEECRSLADELGEDALAVRLDVTDEDSWTSSLPHVARWGGSLNVLVNNAGLTLGDSLEQLEFSEWRRVLSVNLDGVFLGCRHALPYLTKSLGASIVNVSSVWGLKPHAHRAAYSTSKAGVTMLTKSLALYCGEQGYGIRANSVHPGGVLTEMLLNQLSTDEAERNAQLAHMATAHPIGFLGRAEDIADAIVFLAGPKARFITGAALTVDGGLSL